MSKILIPLNNTVWGVITNPIASDRYEHVLSFESKELKTKFIGKELFDDEDFDYNIEIENSPSQSYTRITATEASVSVDLDKYNLKQGTNFDVDDLLNKDFLIVKENEKVLFYAITEASRSGEQNQVIIDFKLSLDIFFTYFDDLNIEGDVPIMRAHTDRYNKDEEYIKENNYLKEEQLEFAQPVIESEKLLIEFDSERDAKNVIWMVIYSSLSEGEEGVLINKSGKGGNRLPYKIFIAPIETDLEFDNTEFSGFFYKNPEQGGEPVELGVGTYNFFRDQATTLSIQFLNNPAIDWLWTRRQPQIGQFALDLNFNTQQTDAISYYETAKCLEIKQLDVLLDDFDVKEISLDKPILTKFDQKKEIQNEVKLKLSQFEKYNFISRDSDNQQEIIRDFLTNDKIEIEYKLGLQAEMITYSLSAKNENINNNILDKRGLFINSNNEIPQNTVSYLNYLNNHRLESKVGYLNPQKILSGAVSGGAIGAGAGSIIPGAGTIAGGTFGAGVGALAGGITGGINHAIEVKDYKTKADKPSNVENGYGFNYIIKERSYIQKKVLPQDYLRTCYDFLYASGYHIRKFDKIDKHLKSRYYFNYIKTGSLFSNIKNNLSADIKQLISSTFEIGFTIWHIRNLDTFKGVANYEYENQEMSLIDYEEDN